MNLVPSSVDLARFRSFIAENLGLGFDDNRSSELLELLGERAAHAKLGIDAYLEALERRPGPELAPLAAKLTVRETYFFRNPAQFDALVELVRKSRSRAEGTLRLLSAGCATGEEPYSMAITLAEALPEGAAAIVACDVNPKVLERARAGRYSAWSLRETNAELRARWFTEHGREFVLAERARRAVRFVNANLASDTECLTESTYDIVFCRNVLMYFKPERARAAVARLARSLKPGGHLFLGHAETLRGQSDDFELCHTHGTFYYRRVGAARPFAAGTRVESPEAPDLVRAPEALWVDAIAEAARRIEKLARSNEAGGAETGQAAQTRSDLSVPFDLLRRERFSEALAALTGLPAAAASDPDTLLLRAALLANAGRLAEAESVCARLLAIDQLSAGAHYVLALCNAGNGSEAEAARQDRVAIYLDPGFAMPHLHLGLLLKRFGEREAAREELERARSLLQREDPARVLMFGGGFNRSALLSVCAAEIERSGGSSP